MAGAEIREDEESLLCADVALQQENSPLLPPNQTQGAEEDKDSYIGDKIREEEKDPLLEQALKRLDAFLFLFGFHQSSFPTFISSWAAFLLLGISIPVLVFELCRRSKCHRFQIIEFEFDILASQAALAAVSLFCVSHNLRKYGVRKFLFVDRYHGRMVRFRKEYIQKIKGFFHLVLWLVLPCFVLKIVHEIIRTISIPDSSWWQSIGILIALVISWTYLTTIFLSACCLFSLVCNLQAIHFIDFGKLLNRDSDVPMLLEEHSCLRHHLSKISHRFRIYLLLAFLVVSASQFVTLFQTTGYRERISFINGGDFALSSIVQVVGLVLCLHAAARISRIAQGISSIASRWHALVTSTSTGVSQSRVTNGTGNLEAADRASSFSINYSESNLESLDNVILPTSTQLVTYMSSYHKRQSLVMYLQSNPGGLTIFGWTVDRTLINTIFFVELSLVLFVLGKTIVFTSK